MRESGVKRFKVHMSIPWHSYATSGGSVMAVDADLSEKSSVIGRVGIIMLGSGTSAWRVRYSMNELARVFGITCVADIGLTTIDYTLIDGSETHTQALSLGILGVNTYKLSRIERFVRDFKDISKEMSIEDLHNILDDIQNASLHRPLIVTGLAAAVACASFTFLCGGGLAEIICAFLGAGAGAMIRALMNEKGLSFFIGIALGAASASLVYAGVIMLAERLLSLPASHEAGYICSMLFLVPGFPFVTSGLDLAKMDMRSGLERLAYSVMVFGVAAIVAWGVAMIIGFEPSELVSMDLPPALWIVLTVVASYFGVFGFSIMFNSPEQIASVAAIIGAIANTVRILLNEYTQIPAAATAFLSAFLAGLLAEVLERRLGYPRIAVNVPAIVIMVPGMYMYRAIYNLGIGDLSVGAQWMLAALMVIIALPLGITFARFVTDRRFRQRG